MKARAFLDYVRAPFILGTLGVALLHAYLSGQVKTLLNPILQPLVLAGGIGLLLAAALHFLLSSDPEFRPVPAPGPLTRRMARDLLLAAALLLGLAAAPQSFSSLALANRQGGDPTLALKSSEQASAPAWQADATGAIKLETTDLLMSAEHADTLAALDGKKVRFIGQFAPGAGGRFQVVRFIMFCCAADAQPVAVDVVGTTPPVKEMTWVEITGTVSFPKSAEGKPTPLVALSGFKSIPEPDDKFLY